MPATRKAKIKTTKFHVNNWTRKWTSSPKYKKWICTLKRGSLKRRSAKADLCAGTHGICKNDLGIPREYMPQFTRRDAPFDQTPLKRFRTFVKRAYGIKTYETTKPAKDLHPSQGEISRARVEGLIEDDLIHNMEIPIVISKDNYIIDGHHRWAAFKVEAPTKPMKVIVIDAPVHDVLGMAIAWGAEVQKF